jgi:hypothetical protein
MPGSKKQIKTSNEYEEDELMMERRLPTVGVARRHKKADEKITAKTQGR